MKKFLCYILILLLILSTTGCSFDPFTKVKANLKKVYVEPENASLLIDEAFSIVEQYLNNPHNKRVPSEKIAELSTNIKIFETDDARIIQYLQPPEIFGNSGKSSWQIFEYMPEHLAVIIQRDTPLDLQYFKVIKIKDRLILYTYSINYEINTHKVSINGFEIKKRSLTEKTPIVEINADDALWGSDKSLGLIFSKKNYSLYIDNVSNDGKTVIIYGITTNPLDKVKLKLKLTEDGVYTNIE